MRGANFYRDATSATGHHAGATLLDGQLPGPRFDRNRFGLQQPSGANLAGQNLTNANFNYATLTDANFSQANLTNANFIATLTNANLSQANLTNANLSLRHADRREPDRGRSAGGELSTFTSPGTGITAAQLYSTASYQAHDLTGIDLTATTLPA